MDVSASGRDLHVLEILLLAVASSLWPMLLAVVLIAIGSAHPKRLLGSFYAGGLITTVVVGLFLVHLIHTSDLSIGSAHQSRAALPLVLGVLAILIALALRRSRHAPRTPSVPAAAAKPGRLSQWLDRSAPVVFLVGVVVNVVPGAFPILGLKDIAELGYGNAATFLTVLGFSLIMFVFLEVPLVWFFIDPDRAADSTRQFNRWLGDNKTMLGAYCPLIVGAYLVVRGLTLAG
jgi:hypothetical protein